MKRPCVFSVLTCPRPVKYVDKCLDSLKAAGVDNYPLVVWDDNPPSGTLNASWSLYRHCVEKYPEHDLVVFEDDVIVCANACPAMMELQVPEDCSFLTFFNTRTRYCEKHPEGIDYYSIDYANSRAAKHVPLIPGIYRQAIKGTNFCYAQGIKIPYEVLKDVARLGPPDKVFRSGDWCYRNGRDIALSACIHQTSHPQAWGIVVPNWVEHIGHASVVLYLKPESELSIKRPVSANWNGINHNALGDLEYLK